LTITSNLLRSVQDKMNIGGNMPDNITALCDAKTVICTAPVPERDYVVGETYDLRLTNHGGDRFELWIGKYGAGMRMFQPEDAAQHFSPTP
jgi:hypothetical protein